MNWLNTLSQKNRGQFNRLGPIALLVLLLCLCWKLASLFWLFVAPPQPMHVERVMLGSEQTQVPNITSFALFQEQQVHSGADLNMTLQGVMLASPADFSSAVIKSNEVSERYRVGQTIEGTGLILSEVRWDRVILRQGASTQELLFKGIENGLNQPLTVAQPMKRNVAPKTQLDEVGRQMTENRQEYLEKMGVQAGVDGVEITQRMPPSVRQRLGVQPGDRILSFNGQRITAEQNIAQLLEQTKQLGQATIEIQRGNQVINIQQDFK